MNRKNIPLILMLVAGAVTCIVNLTQKASVLKQTASLLLVLVIFYFLGSILKWTLDYFDRQNDKEKQKEQENGEQNAEDIEDKDSKAEQSH